MKKIISFFAAGLMALGLIGCSGDLQSNNPKDFPLYIVGDIALDAQGAGTRLPFAYVSTDAEGNEIQTFKFTYDPDKMTAWGGGKGTANFKIVASGDTSDWSKDWGGKQDVAITDSVIQDVAKAATNEYTDLNMRDGSNSNPGNIVIKDLQKDSEYTITLKYKRAADTVSFKIEGTVVYIPKFYIIQDGKDAIEMARNGAVYNYEFSAEADETMKFLVQQDDNTWYAYSSEDAVSNAAAMEFGKSSELAKMTFAVKKGLEYKISVNAADISSLKISGGINNILGSAGITGFNNGWKAGEALTITGKDTAEFAFEGATDTIEFAIQEVAGTWNPRWFAGIPEGKDKPATEKLMAPITATKTNAVTDSDYVEALYYTADPGMDGSNITVTGLPKMGSYKFKLLFKVLDAEKKVISIACVAQETIPESAYSTEGYTDISKMMVAGPFNGWGTPFVENLTKKSDHVYTFELDGTGDAVEFGLITTGWATKYTGATITPAAELNEESAPVSLENGAGNNNKITTTVYGAKYLLTFTENNDYTVSATIKQTTAGSAKPTFSIEEYWVSGLFNEWGEGALTKVSDTVYTYEFTAVADNGDNKNNCFGLRFGSSWSPKFTGATIAVGGEAQTLTKGADNNNEITGCTVGSKYVITFTITDVANEVVTASVAAAE